MNIVTEGRVKGGFPAILKARVQNPEPAVGLPRRYIDHYGLYTLQGKQLTFIKLSTKEENELLDSVLEQL